MSFFALINLTNKKKQKIYDQSTYTKIILKKLLLFFLKSIRMSRKKINFDYKILEKNDFYENKKVFNIDDIDVNKY